VLGFGEGSVDCGGDIGEWDAAVGMVRCAGVPGEFSVVSDETLPGRGTYVL
jgi:hypothetical protein